MPEVKMLTAVIGNNGFGEAGHTAVTVRAGAPEGGEPAGMKVDGIAPNRAELVARAVYGAVRGSLFDGMYDTAVSVTLDPPVPGDALLDLDLPVALGALAATGQLAEDVAAKLDGSVVAGTFGSDGEVTMWTPEAAQRALAEKEGRPLVMSAQVPTLTDLALGRDFAMPPVEPPAPKTAVEEPEPEPGPPAHEGRSPSPEPPARPATPAPPAAPNTAAEGLAEEVERLRAENEELRRALEESQAQEMVSEKLLAERNIEIESLKESLSALQPVQAAPEEAPVTLGDFTHRPAIDGGKITRQYEHDLADGTSMTTRLVPEGQAGAGQWDWTVERGGSKAMGRAESAEAAVAAMNERRAEMGAGPRAVPTPARQERPPAVGEDAKNAMRAARSGTTRAPARAPRPPAQR